MEILSYKETFMINETMNASCKVCSYETIWLQDVVIKTVNIDVLDRYSGSPYKYHLVNRISQHVLN